MNKKPKALMLASVASMIDQFNMQNIQILLESGYDVDVVCNCKDGNTISDDRVKSLIHRLDRKGVAVIHVPIPRKITSIKEIKNSFIQIKRLCDKNNYTLLHCHSPIGSVVARLSAIHVRKKLGTKVIYTAHGFHFYKGAPLKNWMIYYPMEWLCANWTDVLITINKEDYAFAKKHMHAKQVEYVPGIGIDIQKFASHRLTQEEKERFRKSLGISKKEKIFLSVGELNHNKNHEIVIRAIAKLHNPNIHYMIAGTGELYDYLSKLAEGLGISEQVDLLGYRIDVEDLYQAADLYIHPSLREGLPVAVMEAIASNTPVICSAIRGNMDLVKGDALFSPTDDSQIAEKITEYLSHDKSQEVRQNYDALKKFDLAEVIKDMKVLYSRG